MGPGEHSNIFVILAHAKGVLAPVSAHARTLNICLLYPKYLQKTLGNRMTHCIPGQPHNVLHWTLPGVSVPQLSPPRPLQLAFAPWLKETLTNIHLAPPIELPLVVKILILYPTSLSSKGTSLRAVGCVCVCVCFCPGKSRTDVTGSYSTSLSFYQPHYHVNCIIKHTII